MLSGVTESREVQSHLSIQVDSGIYICLDRNRAEMHLNFSVVQKTEQDIWVNITTGSGAKERKGKTSISNLSCCADSS